MLLCAIVVKLKVFITTFSLALHTNNLVYIWLTLSVLFALLQLKSSFTATRPLIISPTPSSLRQCKSIFYNLSALPNKYLHVCCKGLCSGWTFSWITLDPWPSTHFVFSFFVRMQDILTFYLFCVPLPYQWLGKRRRSRPATSCRCCQIWTCSACY